MKLKLNDKVMVIAGKDHGKSGKIIRVLTKHDQVVVEKMNMRTKHIKKTATHAGEKVKFEAAMDSSNVIVVCPGCSKPTRVGYKVLENGNKERVCKKCKESLDREMATAGTKSKSTKKLKTI